MNIVLINPPAYRQVEKYDLASWQHLGIGRLSSYARQFGHEVTLIDAKLQRLKTEEILKLIVDKNPDIVGLTAMTPDIYNAYEIARAVKDINKRIVTVIGGCHATVLPETTLREEPCLDYLVFGEGEKTLKELIDAISGHASIEVLSRIKGVVFRDGDKVVKNESRPWDTHIDELPLPDWRLYPYATHYMLETARGCPFRCNHCMRVLGDTVRHFSVANIMDEFKNIMRLKDKITMEIVDETFTLDHKRIHELLDGMIEIGVGKKVKWMCSTRANLVTKELLEKMKKAGCYLICFGVESGNPRILKQSKKNIQLDDVVRAVKLCREAGIESFLSFILGHPDEKLEEMVDTINFAVRSNPHVASIGTMVPYPGTEIADMVTRGEGNYKLLSKNWTEYNRQFSYVLELNDISKC
ncbi:MAG: radical SAM protein, partial [Candidatus Omnitrophota bacterium]